MTPRSLAAAVRLSEGFHDLVLRAGKFYLRGGSRTKLLTPEDLGINPYNKQRALAFIELMSNEGVSLEEAAQRAYDAGYFPDVAPPSMDGGGNMQAVSGDDLLRAIDDNLAGKRRFARPADQAALDRMRAADDADHLAVANDGDPANAV